MSSERLYTEKEISAILQRSGELHAEQGKTETQGLTLRELQQIAAEVGISADAVASAANELEQAGHPKQGASWAGFPTKLEFDRIVQGEISEEMWPEVAAALNDTFGVVGVSGQVGRMMEWTYSDRKTSQLQVSLIPKDGQTKIRIRGNYTKRAMISLGPLLLGLSLQALIVSLGTGMPWFAAGGVVLSVAATLYMLIRFLFISFIGRKERQSKAFLQRIERLIGTATAETTREHAAQSPPLSPSALDDAAMEAPAAPRNRQRS